MLIFGTKKLRNIGADLGGAVRATRGNFCGPMTMSATTPITSSSEKPISNIARD